MHKVVFDRKIEKRPEIVGLPIEPDGSCGTDNDLQFLLVYYRCPESWRDERIESTHGPARTVDVFLDGSNPL